MKGKAYAHKKKKEDRPRGDFYSTPKSLIWVAEDIIKKEFDFQHIILEPCAGEMSIADELTKYCDNSNIYTNDLYSTRSDIKSKKDYLKTEYNYLVSQIITNPPFSLWDKFVEKAKTHCTKFMFIGRLNYLGTNSRFKSGIWKNLKAVYPFNRYVDFQTPYRTDGNFHVGAMATAWFLWDMEYTGKPILKVLDVQKYATLGNFK